MFTGCSLQGPDIEWRTSNSRVTYVWFGRAEGRFDIRSICGSSAEIRFNITFHQTCTWISDVHEMVSWEWGILILCFYKFQVKTVIIFMKMRWWKPFLQGSDSFVLHLNIPGYWLSSGILNQNTFQEFNLLLSGDIQSLRLALSDGFNWVGTSHSRMETSIPWNAWALRFRILNNRQCSGS